MALLKDSHENIPKDAVILTEEEALRYEIKLLKNWKPLGDVFSIKYGSLVLACAATFVGTYLNLHFRRKFKLFDYGRVTSHLPMAVIPAVGSFVTHTQFVTRDVILNKSCPTCLELRSASLQCITGCVLPLGLAQLSSMALAMRYGTYNVPYLSEGPLKVLQLMAKTTRPIKGALGCLLIGQAVLASAVTYFEQKNIQTVNERLMQAEYDMNKLQANEM